MFGHRFGVEVEQLLTRRSVANAFSVGLFSALLPIPCQMVVAAIGASLTEGPELAALAAAYVLLTDAIGPISTKFADRLVRA